MKQNLNTPLKGVFLLFNVGKGQQKQVVGDSQVENLGHSDN